MTSRSVRRRLRSSIALAVAILAGCAGVVLSAGSAQALTKWYTIDPASPASVTVEFGASWHFDFTLGSKFTPCNGYGCDSWFRVAEQGQQKPLIGHEVEYGGDSRVSFNNFEVGTPLAVGTHVLTLSHHRDHSVYGVASPVTLTIVPAPISASVQIRSDPNHISHAIISAAASGAFVDRVTGSAEVGESFDRMPAGTWDFTVKDAASKVVHKASVQSEAADPPFASVYWTDVPAASTFMATATFTATGSLAANFAAKTSSEVSFTSPPAQASETPPTAAPTVAATPTKTVGIEVPSWVAVLWALLALLLAAALVIMLIRLGRSPSARATAESPLADPGSNVGTSGGDDVL